MTKNTTQHSVLDRLGLGGTQTTPFTLGWLERAISDENCDILRSIVESHHIQRLNLLTNEQKQILNALPNDQTVIVDDSFKDGIMSLDPMHIAMTLIGYKVYCNECNSYIVNEDALIFTTENDDDDEVECPHCHLGSGLIGIFAECVGNVC